MPGLNIDWPIELMHQVAYLTIHGWKYETRYPDYAAQKRDSKTDPLGEGWYKDGFTHSVDYNWDTVKSTCFAETDNAFYAQQEEFEKQAKAAEPVQVKKKRATKKGISVW